jgi:hypothetical protein
MIDTSCFEPGDELKEKLSAIFDKYEKAGDPEARKEYGELGVSESEWLAFCCDKLGILYIC